MHVEDNYLDYDTRCRKIKKRTYYRPTVIALLTPFRVHGLLTHGKSCYIVLTRIPAVTITHTRARARSRSRFYLPPFEKRRPLLMPTPETSQET